MSSRWPPQEAATDLAALRELDPWSPEVAEQEAALARAKRADRRKEQAVFANMFDRQAGQAAA